MSWVAWEAVRDRIFWGNPLRCGSVTDDALVADAVCRARGVYAARGPREAMQWAEVYVSRGDRLGREGLAPMRSVLNEMRHRWLTEDTFFDNEDDDDAA